VSGLAAAFEGDGDHDMILLIGGLARVAGYGLGRKNARPCEGVRLYGGVVPG
jgi:hypothetical protein